MEALLIFLGQAVVSGVVGHYVSEGLRRISPRLEQLMSEKADVKDMVAFVQQEGLEEALEAYAASVAKSSYVIPVDPTGGRNLGARAGVMAEVLCLAFEVAHARQVDLLLPGSFLRGSAYTLLVGNEAGAPSVQVRGNAVTIGGASLTQNVLRIFPVQAEEGVEVWEEYKAALRAFRGAGSGEYFSSRRLKVLTELSAHCEVRSLAALEICYWHGIVMPPRQRKALGLQGAQTAPIEDPYPGIDAMLEGVSEILAIEALPEGESEAIERVVGKLERFRSPRKSQERS